MSMQEQCEFFIVRYFADPIRDEPINIGIILMAIGTNDGRPPIVRITKNWRRVRCMDPYADMDLLGMLEESLQRRIAEAGSDARLALEKLNESLSTSLRLQRSGDAASVQLAGGRVTLTDAYDDEIARLMQLYVEDRTDETGPEWDES